MSVRATASESPSMASTEQDDFSRDLIHAFDTRRSQLRQEMALEPSTTHTRTQPKSTTPAKTEPTPTDATPNRRRRSAGELLRRSSAYFKAKLDAFKGSRSHDNLKAPAKKDSPPSVPFKMAINTTMALPPSSATQHSFGTLRPPIITHYPPKPLYYSPVTPIDTPLTDPPLPSSRPVSSSSRSIVHRLSLPLLRHSAHGSSVHGSSVHGSSVHGSSAVTDTGDSTRKKDDKHNKPRKGKERATA
ncbi:hypothetical protein BDF14DRAFT_124662 [Spinellus fusiger]|nr:hypothetical protein BDF14DRAFT_124662 [Spinellus fusiger]